MVGREEREVKGNAYSWSSILSGIGRIIFLHILGNCIFFRISDTSAFLLSSSPSFSPEAKWLHTKQNAVWWTVMLIDMHPCNVSSLGLVQTCVFQDDAYFKLVENINFRPFKVMKQRAYEQVELTLLPRQPMIPLPMHETLRWPMCWTKPSRAQTERKRPTICLLAIRLYPMEQGEEGQEGIAAERNSSPDT